MEAAFTESIREVKAEGRSVLLSSHIFAEVERLADQVTIIREGVTVESGTIAELRHLTRSQVTVGLDRGADGLAALPGVHDLQQLDGHVTFAVDDAELPGCSPPWPPLAPAVPGGQPAIARGAVPAPLRHRARRAERRGAMTTTTQPDRAVDRRRQPDDRPPTRWPGPAPWSGSSCGATGCGWPCGGSCSSACSPTSRSYYRDILDTQQALDDFAAVSNVPSIKALTGLAAAPEHARRGGLDQDLDDLRAVPGPRRGVPRDAQRPRRRGARAHRAAALAHARRCTPARSRRGR